MLMLGKGNRRMLRSFLVEKWTCRCAYCGILDVPLEIEHIIPKSRGGKNVFSNLTLACHSCNQKKADRTASEFGFAYIESIARMPFKEAYHVNILRFALMSSLAPAAHRSLSEAS